MKIHKIEYKNTNSFPSLLLDYLSQKSDLKEFYDLFPQIENFPKKIAALNFDNAKRNVLHTTLNQQYSGFDLKVKVKENISLVTQPHTFTITTGHQLNLFTGPLYFIYKIITVINACKVLKEKYPRYNFVPVYWMASEDHDFQEINHFNLFNKKYTWETDQQGAVGRFSTAGLEKIFEETPEELPLFKKAYLGQKNLSAATRYLVNELFGEDGLIILDADDRALKSQFADIVKDELLNQVAHKKITETAKKLEGKGYDAQINPREINLFYLDKNSRERIVANGGEYKLSGSEVEFSEKELLHLIDTSPEIFSPNVALRPLYQQAILPNIAYCGGPAEINYWLQLKTTFDHYKIPFPILLPRVSALVVSRNIFDKINKLNISLEDLFLKEELIKDKLISSVSGEIYRLEEEEIRLKEIFDQIRDKAKSIDASLEGFIEGEKQRLVKQLEGVEKKLKKASEAKNEVLISQASGIKAKLFPNGNLQERTDNFLNFYINNSNFLSNLKQSFDPFDFRFNVLIQE
ncbi:MAG: bacillithiol biosynthesis cysteine-adding enzyme BshC [Cytophagaceae bacterium]|nr:bacillithiol biosynthesis cysteine-adding enzyme BshC [Cytophagaceae bacterium]